MGHDLHFLQRLERVSGSHLDVAMSLYRDPGLVREIFSRAEIPDSATRVAVSLADPVDGPFVLLERGGRFVTCLGPGMRTDDLPLISRQKLESVAAQVAKLRERLELAAKVTDGRASAEHLPFWRKLLREPELLSREDVAGLVAWLPTLAELMVEVIIDSHTRLADGRALLRTANGSRNDPRIVNVARLDGRVMLSSATMVQLLLAHPALMEGRFAPLPDGDSPAEIMYRRLFHRYELLFMMRASNGLAVGGKPNLSGFKRHLGTSSTRMGTYALALGHPKLRGEIRKLLERPSVPWGPSVLQLLDREVEFREDALMHGRDGAVRLAKSFGRTPWRAAEDVPEHVAVAAAAALIGELPSDLCTGYAISVLPLLARAEPEDLYLPAELIAQFALPSPEQLMWSYVERYARYNPRQPVRVERTPGRNDPCSCDSGRKFKKCCGA